MEPFLLGEIRELVKGKLIQGSDDFPIIDVAYYPERMKKPNSLLFFLRKRDINWDNIRRCAPCAIITNEIFNELKTIACSIILVENVQTAYWEFVDHYRNIFRLPVIAVTGTCGKTTTKDMIKHILKYNYKVHGTKYSANGNPGHLPNLLGIDKTIEAAVFETGVARPGDITNSCRYFKPKIGIITNIGIDHLDKCKTVERYIQAKAEMVTILDDEGILVVNADDQNSINIGLENFKGRIVYFGIHNSAHFQASDVKYSENGMNFVLTLQQMKYPFFVPGYGNHQVYNALATLAAVHELGIGMKEAANQLQTFINLRAHLQLTQGINNSLLLDDSWHSNLTSIKSALQVLNDIAGGRKKIFLISDIKELGEFTNEAHCQVGGIIAEVGVDILVTVGADAELIANQASEKGLAGEIYSYPTIYGVFEFLENTLDENTIMLIKAVMGNKDFYDLIRRLKVG